MRIVLLTGARGLRPETIATAREQLGAGPDDHFAVVSWHHPKGVLPVIRHILIGPSFTNPAKQLSVAPDATPEGFSWRRPASAAKATAAATPAQAPVARRGSLLDPATWQKAAAWRARRVLAAARKAPGVPALQSEARKVSNRIANSTKVRKAAAKVMPGGPSAEFAAACVRSPQVAELVSQADLVVAIDGNTHLGAWMLARRHPLPYVVVGYPAAKQWLDNAKAEAN